MEQHGRLRGSPHIDAKKLRRICLIGLFSSLVGLALAGGGVVCAFKYEQLESMKAALCIIFGLQAVGWLLAAIVGALQWTELGDFGESHHHSPATLKKVKTYRVISWISFSTWTLLSVCALVYGAINPAEITPVAVPWLWVAYWGQVVPFAGFEYSLIKYRHYVDFLKDHVEHHNDQHGHGSVHEQHELDSMQFPDFDGDHTARHDLSGRRISTRRPSSSLRSQSPRGTPREEASLGHPYSTAASNSDDSFGSRSDEESFHIPRRSRKQRQRW